MIKRNHAKKANLPLEVFCRALRKYDHYLLACHVLPEGDAIGSLLAMESLLRRMGKRTFVAAEDYFPPRLFCLSSKRWNQIDFCKLPKKPFQALVTTDCPTLERIGRVRDLLSPDTVIFNIDHHVSNEYFGHCNYVRPEAAATGEVVFDIFRKMRVPLTKEDATNLYVALSTDTGSFKYGNTTIRSHQIAAELIRIGIDLEKINNELYATYSLNKINLYSRLLGRVRTSYNGKVAWVAMTREDFRQSGAQHEDAEGFIDFLKYLREVEIAFVLIESMESEHVRVSFRSKDSHDVNRIASHFKGGGHRKAAGCMIPSSLEEAEKNVLQKIFKTFEANLC